MINNKGEEVGIIYGWYCTVTDKWYVGQTIHPLARFNRHIHQAIEEKDNNKFHNALRKYKLSDWVYCVLEENILRQNLNMKEQEWIEYYDSYYSGYNLTTGGDSSYTRVGFPLSEESRRKLSESLKGKNKGKSPWNKGKHGVYTEECQKRRMESINKKREEINEKISKALKGRHQSEESKLKNSIAHRGENNANYGKHLPENVKRKISLSHIGIVAPNRKKVNQYDKEGNFIRQWDSIWSAKKAGFKANICYCCQGKIPYANGFIWKYAS